MNLINNSKYYTKNLVLLAIGITVCIVLLDFLKKRKKRNKFIKTALPFIKPKGKFLFGISPHHRLTYASATEGNICLVGSTGSGKTSSVLIPALRNLVLCNQKKNRSIFCIDISGDLEQNIDIKKLVYAPNRECSDPYNILHEIDQLNAQGQTDQVNEALLNLALTLIPMPANADSSSIYFTTGARSILQGSLIALYHRGFDFIDIMHEILSHSVEELFKRIYESQNAYACHLIDQFKGNSSQNVAGCYQQLIEKIILFNNPIIKKNLRRPRTGETDIYPERIEESSIFLDIPDHMLSLYQPLLNLICNQVLEYCSKRDLRLADTREIFLILDEFSSLGYLMDIQQATRKYRKRGVRLVIAVQSFLDIDLLYSETVRKSLLNNFRYLVILNSIDYETCRDLAGMIGHNPEQKHKTNADWIIAPEDLSTLDLRDDLILVYPGGFKILKKCFYFKKLNQLYI